MEKKRAKIFNDIERIANLLPTPVYWLDTKGIVVGVNVALLKIADLIDASDVIVGKSHYDFYPKDVADTLTENNNKVLQFGKTMEFEEKIVNITTGQTQYFTAVRSPLRDDDGTIIGVIGTSVEITEKKEAEALRIQNAVQNAALEEQKKFGEFMDKLNQIIRAYAVDTLNEKVGIVNEPLSDSHLEDIHLTKREYEILYLLSNNKNEREIAAYLSKIDGKPVTTGYISAVIRDHLYRKFQVSTNAKLIENAIRLKMMPFMPERFK